MKVRQDLIDLAKGVKAVVLDFEGVITDNCEYTAADGTFFEVRSHTDGQGISFLRAIGMHVAITTAKSSFMNQPENFPERLVRRWNDLPSARSGDFKPIRLIRAVDVERMNAVEKWLKEIGLKWTHCAVMGDDRVDVSMLQKAGLKAAPVTAEDFIKEMCQFVSERPAGRGAVRDLVNFILDVQGHKQAELPFR